ncbi:hypothetical protein [Bacteroides rodentium]
MQYKLDGGATVTLAEYAYDDLAYTFAYDGLNRLTDAVHGAGRYTEKVTAYDKNGNIRNLQRYGQTSAGTYGMIDNLTFTFDGNRLSRVDDSATASAYNNGFEFKDAAKQANEYAYDANLKSKSKRNFLHA